MKKILSFILVLIMVMSTGVIFASAQDNETEILPPINDATEDEASRDEASKDESSTDEEIITSMVYDYFLEITEGRNPFVKEPDGFFDGYNISYSLEVAHLSEKDSSQRFAVVDLNYPEDTYEVYGEAVVKIGDSLLINEVHTCVAPYLGMGYYVVLTETGEVMQLRDALRLGIDGLKDVCLDMGMLRLIGDVTADGKLNIRDATWIQKLIAGFEGYEAKEYMGFGYHFSIADFNGDNDVNIRDVTNIQKFLAGIPFDFMRSKAVRFTDIPENANPLEIEVVTDEPNYYDYDEPVLEFITNAEEYLEVTGEESEVYNEAFFKEKNLVCIIRVFGSGSYNLEILGAYMWGQDTLLIDSIFMTVPPGYGVTDDVVSYRAFIAVDKTATENVENITVYEDVDFHTLKMHY